MTSFNWSINFLLVTLYSSLNYLATEIRNVFLWTFILKDSECILATQDTKQKLPIVSTRNVFYVNNRSMLSTFPTFSRFDFRQSFSANKNHIQSSHREISSMFFNFLTSIIHHKFTILICLTLREFFCIIDCRIHFVRTGGYSGFFNEFRPNAFGREKKVWDYFVFVYSLLFPPLCRCVDL